MSNHFFSKTSDKNLIKTLGSQALEDVLSDMLLIRQFELRGESAYQSGFIGGFYHSYIGQEAIATAAVHAFGQDNWYSATYRCHALALLLGATPNELMAELFGRATGNAKGRGGSMHLYTDRLLGGFAIVGGHLPIAAGAAFSIKYLKKKEVSVCFLGDGAVAQGAFHESLNLASLWQLPVIFIIENNNWGMGTHVSRAVCQEDLAESFAPAYKMKGYTLDGMDFFNCYEGFKQAYDEVKSTSKPVLIECKCERFKGHSISDPGLYRSKENLQEAMKDDPILRFKQKISLCDEKYTALELEAKNKILDAIEFAKQSPWPSIATLEQEVYAD
jgi:pyruvate dehydrogenase E1 component alpha subunit